VTTIAEVKKLIASVKLDAKHNQTDDSNTTYITQLQDLHLAKGDAAHPLVKRWGEALAQIRSLYHQMNGMPVSGMAISSRGL
jgi:hypothetical protein